MKVYTIGHSNRSILEFLSILKAYNISLLIDIRTVPGSRHNPQFNQSALAESLSGAGIKYIHEKGLGGFRKPRSDSINKGWMNDGFRGFADYMQTDEFKMAINRVIELKDENVVLMCAEGNPFRCHRSLISDALVIKGIRVEHITGKEHITPHRLTPFAEVNDDEITYP